jgi:hypothetical protein
MNEKLARKIRKAIRKERRLIERQYYSLPLTRRLDIALRIIFRVKRS